MPKKPIEGGRYSYIDHVTGEISPIPPPGGKASAGGMFMKIFQREMEQRLEGHPEMHGQTYRVLL